MESERERQMVQNQREKDMGVKENQLADVNWFGREAVLINEIKSGADVFLGQRTKGNRDRASSWQMGRGLTCPHAVSIVAMEHHVHLGVCLPAEHRRGLREIRACVWSWKARVLLSRRLRSRPWTQDPYRRREWIQTGLCSALWRHASWKRLHSVTH